MGLRDDFLSNQDLPVSDALTIPGVSGMTGTIHFRTLSATEQDELDDKAVNTGIAGMRAMFAAYVLSDEHGNRIFGELDIERLGKMQASVLSWVFDKGREWNEIDTDGVASIEGNSQSPKSDSGSA